MVEWRSKPSVIKLYVRAPLFPFLHLDTSLLFRSRKRGRWLFIALQQTSYFLLDEEPVVGDVAFAHFTTSDWSSRPLSFLYPFVFIHPPLSQFQCQFSPLSSSFGLREARNNIDKELDRPKWYQGQKIKVLGPNFHKKKTLRTYIGNIIRAQQSL